MLFATTQGHDLFSFKGGWHNFNSRLIQQISAGTGNTGQPVVYAITQVGDLARFDLKRCWFLPNPPKALAEVRGLMADGVMGRNADGSVLEFTPATGWIDLAVRTAYVVQHQPPQKARSFLQNPLRADVWAAEGIADFAAKAQRTEEEPTHLWPVLRPEIQEILFAPPGRPR